MHGTLSHVMNIVVQNTASCVSRSMRPFFVLSPVCAFGWRDKSAKWGTLTTELFTLYTGHPGLSKGPGTTVREYGDEKLGVRSCVYAFLKQRDADSLCTTHTPGA